MTVNVPNSPRELGLDKDAWWDGQRETVSMIVDAFLSGKKYVLAGIPTGGGKTIIAAAVQKILATYFDSGGAGGSSLALTHTKQLQAQYQETLKDAAVITGRSNWACELPRDNIAWLGEDNLTAETAPCGEGGSCDAGLKGPHGCGYYRQWWEAAKAPMVIMNYAYASRILPIEYFSEEDPNTGKMKPMENPFRRQLLVADECHLAHNALVEAAGTTLWMGPVRKWIGDVPSEFTRRAYQEGNKVVYYENTDTWAAWARDAYDKVDPLVGETKRSLEAIKRNRDDTKRIIEARREYRSLKAMRDALAPLVDDNMNWDQWVIRRDKDAKGGLRGIVFQPLWGWTCAHERLLQYFDRVLLMSATPGDPDVARVTMGIPKDEFVYIERPSTFPVANRPVWYWPIVKLNYKSTQQDWEKVADAIAYIASQPQWRYRKGIVHSGSQANAHRIVDLVNRRLESERAFSHGGREVLTGGTREDALAIFRDSDEPRILVTASFTTGLDLPDIIGWQVIAKVPYGSLADEITARRRAFKLGNDPFGQRFYTAEAMNTVVQAAGRVVRHPNDKGPTFILDANYTLLHNTAFRPKFYTEAFQKLEFETSPV